MLPTYNPIYNSITKNAVLLSVDDYQLEVGVQNVLKLGGEECVVKTSKTI